jgi:hypothetical protein
MKSPSGFAGHTRFPIFPLILMHFIILIISLTSNPLACNLFAAQVDANDNLTEGSTDNIPVTAVDTTVNESNYSSDIPKTIPIIPDYALTIIKTGSGTGTVTGREISCGTTCTGLFPQGTTIELTADPDTGSSFAGWSGGACTGTAPCTLTMDVARSVTAKFNKAYTITATADVNGTITPLGPATTSQASDKNATISVLSVNHGTSQTFRISPDPGYHVAGIQMDGTPVDIASTYTFVNVRSNHTITATFAPDSYASSGRNGRVTKAEPDY